MKRRARTVWVVLGATLLVGVVLGPRVMRKGRHLVQKAERAMGLIDAPAPRERKSTPEGLSLWLVDESIKVRPGDDLGAPAASPKAELLLTAARGETAAIQLVAASSAPLSLDVTVEALKGPRGVIEASRVEVFLETFIDTPRTDPAVMGLGPGEYPDPLIPLRDSAGRNIASPVKVTPKRNQPLWIDISVPRSTEPGSYQGTLHVVPQGRAPRDISVKLEVLPFEIPAKLSLFSWVPIYATRLARGEGLGDEPNAARYAKTVQAYAKMAHAHRFSTQVMEDQPRTRWNEAEGKLESVDWAQYDAVNGPILDGSLFDDHEPPLLWKVGGFVWWGARPGDPPHFGGNFMRDSAVTPAHKNALIAYMRAYRAHFDEHGWKHSSLFAYMIDEPNFSEYPKQPGLIADYGRALHAANVGVQHLVTVGPRSDLYDGVDIWATWGGGYVPSAMGERQRAHQHAWFYQHHEPFVGGNCINNDGLAMRTWPWIAWRYQSDAIFLWVGNFWGDDPYRQAMNWDDELLGNGIFFYPGHKLTSLGFPEIEGPVASLRMKAMRRGLFDYEYFALLRKLGGDADSLVRRIVRSALNEDGADPVWKHPRWEQPGDWSHDPTEWAAARREAIQQIVARLPKP